MINFVNMTTQLICGNMIEPNYIDIFRQLPTQGKREMPKLMINSRGKSMGKVLEKFFNVEKFQRGLKNFGKRNFIISAV